MMHRAAAEGFEGEADRYQRARPGYHPELVERFVSSFGSGRVIEIGAGTGIFTAELVGRGVEVLAIEPVDAMRKILARRLAGADVAPGTAERLPAETDSFDVAVVAQAFHWFDHAPALDEIHRVLRPGGHLVTVWNVKEGDTAWYRRYMDIIERHAADTPRHADMRWRRAIDGDARFELVDDWQIDNSQPIDEDGIVDRALSTSFIAALPDDQRALVASDIRAALAGIVEPLRFPYRGELQAWVTSS